MKIEVLELLFKKFFMWINFNRHTPYFHEHDFPVSKILEKYKDRLIYDYKTTPRPFTINNIEIKYEGLLEELTPKFNGLIQHFYQVNPPINELSPYLYMQNKNNSINDFHTHIHINAKPFFNFMVATFYLHDLKDDEGGGLEIMIPPYDPIYIKTKKDKLYTFPHWLLHRPSPQTSNNLRLCLNWGYKTNQKFTHRISKDIW